MNESLDPSVVITPDEINAIQLYCERKHIKMKKINANEYMRTIAKMGGFLGRKSDGNPGSLVFWRGYLRLQDIILGMSLVPP